MPVWDDEANHGRYGGNDYPGCAIEAISHDSLNVGSHCPQCLECSTQAKLYSITPGVVVQLVGHVPITGTRYEIEKLRCPVCATVYPATVPPQVNQRSKYDSTVTSAIAIYRYLMGLPHYRLQTLQAMVGIPVPDASQWDLMQQLYQIIKPVHEVLVDLSAQSDLLYYDDTSNKILQQAHKASKKAITTAIVCQVGHYQTHLFMTNYQSAGREVEQLLAKRETQTPLITMCDALSSNIPHGMNEALLAKWIFCFCLSHGRRKFYELQNDFDSESRFVLDVIGQVYHNDKYCKENQLSAHERLLYHQQHSQGHMEALQDWLNNQLLQKQVEPNSTLGQAIHYLLKHWQQLTQFLRHAGAPLDSNIAERAIKVVIRYRKNSLFYRSDQGAKVGDALMGILYTAASAGVDVFDYLNQLQAYQQLVANEPECWLPWHYQSTLAAMTAEQTLAA